MNPFEMKHEISTPMISNLMRPLSLRHQMTRNSSSELTISSQGEGLESSRSSAIAGRMLVAASIAIGLMVPSMAVAANIFVSETRGTTAQTPSSTDVSDMIKSAIESMPEHQLVDSESSSDFTLRPRVINRTNGLVLHIDRYRGETLLSSGEESLAKVESDQDGAYQVVTNTFKGNDTPPASAANDRALAPTYGEEASQTRGDQVAPASPAAAGSVGASVATSPDASGAAHTGEMARADQSAKNSNVNSNSNMNSMDRTSNDSPPFNTTNDRINDQAREPSSDQLSSQTIAPLDAPSKTMSAPVARPNATASQQNPFGHPMNPGATLDLPASDYGTSGAGEMRTDSFKRTSVFGGPGYFTAAAGAGFSGGLRADNTMFNVDAGYAIDYTPLITGKAFVDMTLGTGSDVARFVDLAVGANYYPPQVQSGKSKPYVGGDVGLGLVRNNLNDSQASLAVGATGGFQFLADTANLDLALRYEVLATQIDGATAQLLGLKVGMDF